MADNKFPIKIVFPAEEFKAAVEKLETAFAANPVSEAEAKSLDELRIELAPDADKPTTASAKPGQTDLPSVQIQIDPSGVSAVFPGAAIQLSSITSLVGSTTQSTRNEILYLALADAYRILINEYSYEEVVIRLDSLFGNGGINLLSSNLKDVVRKSIAEIIKDVSEYGPEDIPQPDYYKLVEADFEEIPENVVTVPPQFYKQQYRRYIDDPFPGYEEWNSDEEEVVYIERVVGDFYYENMQEDILGTSSLEIAAFLRPYIITPELALTIKEFDDMLIQQEKNIKKNGMDKSLGAGAGSGGASALSQLLGPLSVAINLQVDVQLPDSVLNAPAIKQSMDAFSESMAMVKRINQMIDQALQIPNILNDLANIGLSQLTNALNLNNILGSLNIPGLNVDLNGLNFNFEGINVSINTPVLTDAISKLQNASFELRNSLSDVQNDLNQFRNPILQAANRLEAIAATQRLSIAIG